MISLALVAGKYPAKITPAANLFAARLPRISRALSVMPWRLSAAQKKKLPKKVQLGIQIITDKAMLKVNTAYRQKRTTTDVLSFSYLESGQPFFPHEPVGEICISYQTAAQQAREYGLALQDELCVLAVHGALHVMGYDHELSDRASAAMHRAEVKVLAAAGIGVGLTGRQHAPAHGDLRAGRKKR